MRLTIPAMAGTLVLTSGFALSSHMSIPRRRGGGGEGNRAFRCLYSSGGAGGTWASVNGGDGGSMNLNSEDCSRGSLNSDGGGGSGGRGDFDL
jgi:hypothetical protein